MRFWGNGGTSSAVPNGGSTARERRRWPQPAGEERSRSHVGAIVVPAEEARRAEPRRVLPLQWVRARSAWHRKVGGEL